MKGFCEEYYLTHTVEEALDILSASPRSARILSGGTDLLLEIQQGIHPTVRTLVDVTEIDEMCALEITGDNLFIGASVTLTELKNSALIQQHAQALADATILMANPQVCNVATIGGNVAHALPAADGTIALLALDVQAEVANLDGRRRLPLRSLFKGPGISTLEASKDLLVGFYLPLCGKGQASAFARRVNPQGIALAMLNIAIWCQCQENHIQDIRIAVGPSGPIPLRMIAAENALRNHIPSAQRRGLALEALLGEAHFRSSSHRATAEYRRHLAGILLEEAFSTAWARAMEKQ
jgi:CO/xanthine dehydrogenase FAD-binding subunit